MTIRAFKIIESTLREGEQFAPAHFTPAQKVAIAQPVSLWAWNSISQSTALRTMETSSKTWLGVAIPTVSARPTRCGCRRSIAW